ncbi:glycosyltransferase family A protein [Sphingobium lignivorans]|uniref:Glycosyltransferase involved in cell wall biosynthesis n=1 Tax=Sphingobium lignivorans TaxID=2735886 RepID=A0ABR6NIW1_9SPHN|nr:glycosyltransferase family A protein [Sphingobium lignivorans]MBB5987206.1 glycosyltransferase involved in cell wall biosynthesis [Sphingobium lignivorans]
MAGTAVAIFAHDEQRRIAACLASLPLDRPGTVFHLLVNGSTDRTAAIARAIAARHPALIVHEWPQGGKARSWNRFVHELLPADMPEAVIFMDGDAEIAPGSFDALIAVLRDRPHANAVAGLPFNGRRHRVYQALLREEGGLFGDLYALRGDFLRRLRARGLRLPVDLVGDDGLVAAWAATDLGPDADWDRARLAHADAAGFLCEPVRLLSPRGWRLQYRRMVSYAVRHFQNRMVSRIMGTQGPTGLPERLSSLYAGELPAMRPRPGLANALFDRLALRRMAHAAMTSRS